MIVANTGGDDPRRDTSMKLTLTLSLRAAPPSLVDPRPTPVAGARAEGGG